MVLIKLICVLLALILGIIIVHPIYYLKAFEIVLWVVLVLVLLEMALEGLAILFEWIGF